MSSSWVPDDFWTYLPQTSWNGTRYTRVHESTQGAQWYRKVQKGVQRTQWTRKHTKYTKVHIVREDTWLYKKYTTHTNTHNVHFHVLCMSSYTLCMLVYFSMQRVLCVHFLCFRTPCVLLYTKNPKAHEVHLCALYVLLCPLCTLCSLVCFCALCVLLCTSCVSVSLVWFCTQMIQKHTKYTLEYFACFGVRNGAWKYTRAHQDTQ